MKKILLVLGLILGFWGAGTIEANASEVNVSSWPEFVTAWNDSTVTKISLTQNIDSTALSTSTRTTGVEINGSGYTINFDAGTATQHSLDFSNPSSSASDQSPVLNIHDISLVAVSGTGVRGFIYTNESTRSSSWTVSMSNISYSQQFTAGGRFATVGGAKVKLSGNIDIRSNYENFVGAQSIDISENTHYYGVSNNSSNNNGSSSSSGAGGVSTWYMTSTAGDGHISIGSNAVVSLVNYRTNNTYSPIFYHFGTVTINDGAVFNLNGGTAGINWYLNDTQGNYVVKDGATMSVSSNTAGGSVPVINFSNTGSSSGNQGISVEKGGSFFVIGAQTSGTPLIQMTGSNASQFIKLDSPKAFDINNQGSTNNAAINVTRGKFSISDSNITIWDNGVNTLTDPASSAYEKVENFSYDPTGGINSSDSALSLAYKNNSTARISGLNQQIRLYIQPWSTSEDLNNTTSIDSDIQNGTIWDTDKTVRVRVSMGELPSSGIPDPTTGLLSYKTVWATKNQVTLTGQDSLGNGFSQSTNENGFTTISNNYFQKATTSGGLDLSFYGKYGDFEQTITADVTDKTPPAPVKITSETSVNSIITGTSDIGATITAKISHDNGSTWSDAANTTTVDSDGNFTLGKIDGLSTGDTVQIFAEDTQGNKEPSTDTTIHDAEIEGATKYVVAGSLSWSKQFTSLNFGSQKLSSKNKVFAAEENNNSVMSVSDTRGVGGTWRVTAYIIKKLTSEDGKDELNGSVIFKNNNVSNILSQTETLIAEHSTTTIDDVAINDSWNTSTDGIFLDIPSTKHPLAQKYSGEIGWNLEDVPEND